jgi:BirA family biotin operon repressor/biotin-[acetyl-CoA-carboxylase] ligase
LRRALLVAGQPWTELRVVASTGSTNADVVAAARTGAPEGLVLVAEEQTAGRGRLDRAWATPPRTALAVSVLLRPDPVPLARWSWLPLLTGLAVVTALRRVAEVPARLKWPNDVLVGERKLAGILAERVAGDHDAVVVGLGLNVSLRAEELPVPAATSLTVEGAATTDRDPLLRAVLRELGTRYTTWCAAGGDVDADGTRTAYVSACATLGRHVRVHLPGDGLLEGEAVEMDSEGRLVIDAADEIHAVGAGDIVHVR